MEFVDRLQGAYAFKEKAREGSLEIDIGKGSIGETGAGVGNKNGLIRMLPLSYILHSYTGLLQIQSPKSGQWPSLVPFLLRGRLRLGRRSLCPFDFHGGRQTHGFTVSPMLSQ